MSRTRHKIPTGLAVEDRFIAYGALSLSFRQFLILLGGAAVGYGGVWQGQPDLPVTVRAGTALLPPLLALVVALARPGGRPLESWLFVLARFSYRSRVTLWRPRPPQLADWQPTGPDWADVPSAVETILGTLPGERGRAGADYAATEAS